jgi:AraC-like DNA-binding protein
LHAALAVVRYFTGPRWQPETIGVRANLNIDRCARDAFPNTRFVTGERTAWISVPRAFLGLAPDRQLSSSGATANLQGVLIQLKRAPWTFAASLRLLLEGYLAEGTLSIDLGAELCCTSVRTLQRRLRTCGYSFSELVEHARCEIASRLLRSTDARIIDIGQEVGYTDPTHFSRAFRRLTGTSPRDFRHIHRSH